MAEIDVLREDQEELLKIKHSLNSLLSSEGWRLLSDFLLSNIRVHRQTDFDSPIGSLDDAFKSADRRGFMSGLATVQEAPKDLLDDANADLSRIETEIEELQRDAS